VSKLNMRWTKWTPDDCIPGRWYLSELRHGAWEQSTFYLSLWEKGVYTVLRGAGVPLFNVDGFINAKAEAERLAKEEGL